MHPRGVTRKTEYEENEKRIQELEQQKQEMAQGNRRDLLDMDSVQAARLAELKRQIANLKRQRRRLTSQISAMRADVEIDDSSFYRDYDDLLEFFPSVDIRHITEIDDFHRKLKKVLRDEYRENEGKLNDTVELLDIQIALLEQEADAINATPSLSQAVLDGYAEIDREIRNRQAANEFYVKKDELQATREELQGRLDKLIGELTRELQTDINIRLKELNDSVCMGRKTAPHLAIQGAKKYEYAIPNDIGTGSLTRGLFLFDIVCAEMTPLPAVIHDSMSVKQVEDPVMLKILELYRASQKQFFVAIDKGESYTDDRKIPDVIREAIRLRLSPGHELFGRPWNEVKKENTEEGKRPEEQDGDA